MNKYDLMKLNFIDKIRELPYADAVELAFDFFDRLERNIGHHTQTTKELQKLIKEIEHVLNS